MSRGLRWPALILALALGALATAGCDDGEKRPPPTRKRSDVVKATNQPSAAPTPSASATATAPKKDRKVCVQKPAGLEHPKGIIATAKAAGGADLPNPIPFGAGKWIWLNLWAVWCKPCIAEMPRLMEFHGQLRKEGVLVDLALVSFDDDGRQLQRFLDKQPKTGVRSTYWLKEEARSGWLEPLRVKADAELPVHVLVDPKGEVACVINGAIEPDDFPKLRKLFKSGG